MQPIPNTNNKYSICRRGVVSNVHDQKIIETQFDALTSRAYVDTEFGVLWLDTILVQLFTDYPACGAQFIKYKDGNKRNCQVDNLQFNYDTYKQSLIEDEIDPFMSDIGRCSIDEIESLKMVIDDIKIVKCK